MLYPTQVAHLNFWRFHWQDNVAHRSSFELSRVSLTGHHWQNPAIFLKLKMISFRVLQSSVRGTENGNPSFPGPIFERIVPRCPRSRHPDVAIEPLHEMAVTVGVGGAKKDGMTLSRLCGCVRSEIPSTVRRRGVGEASQIRNLRDVCFCCPDARSTRVITPVEYLIVRFLFFPLRFGLSCSLPFALQERSCLLCVGSSHRVLLRSLFLVVHRKELVAYQFRYPFLTRTAIRGGETLHYDSDMVILHSCLSMLVVRGHVMNQ